MFHENWYHRLDREQLAKLAVSTNHLDGAVIEVGAWEGRSTVALANAVNPTVVDVVDTWQGSPGEACARIARRRDVFAVFEQNMAELTNGNYRAHRTDWRVFFAAHDRPIRLLHLDGAHTYDEVYDNIQAALPMMTPGSVMVGDDRHIDDVWAAVTDSFGTVDTGGALWWAYC